MTALVERPPPDPDAADPPGAVLVIEGDPRPLLRARIVRRGRHAALMDPEENVSAKALFQSVWLRAGRPRLERGVPIELELVCMFARPASHYGTGRNHLEVRGRAPVFHTQRPDLDNLVKLVKDALNGLAWHDDSQIVSLSANKLWTTETPRTLVSFTGLVPTSGLER